MRDVTAACATHIQLPRIPAHVTVSRHGQRLSTPRPADGDSGTTTRPGLFLQVGDQIRVTHRAVFSFSYAGNSYRIPHGHVRLECRSLLLGSLAPGRRTTVLAVAVRAGRVRVRAGRHSRRALVVGHEMVAFATRTGTTFVVDRNPAIVRTRAWTMDHPIIAARASDPALRIDTRRTYTAISDARGIRLDVWPFSISPLQRQTTPSDHLVPFWSDGLRCSVGCAAPAVPGWPLKPFHKQHAIRAGINELRPANFHVGVDIEAKYHQRVYAIQSGFAHIRYPGTPDVNVDVGRFYYWHIRPTVSDGQHVVAYRTVIGKVLFGFKHVALSEGTTSDYLNPLRPGGRLRPYRDIEPPVIGRPRVFTDGRVTVGAFDPQSFVDDGQRYETPVLAPSSLAWRLYEAHGRPLTALEWAMRGSQNYPPRLRSVIFAPGAANPGFRCFFTQVRCIPNWVYRLAGGLTPPVPLAGLRSGRYRLAVYAWDWAGNTSARDYWIKLPLAGKATAPNTEFGRLEPRFDYP